MKTYSELIKENDRKFYSLNFLLAEFEKKKSSERERSMLSNRIECEYFETKDFQIKSYYKPVSRCIKNFAS